MKPEIVFYKIKDTSTGLYSTGGRCPSFHKKGKIWNNIAHVKAHLVGLRKHEDSQINSKWLAKTFTPVEMKTWVVEQFTFKQENCEEIPIAELIISAGLF